MPILYRPSSTLGRNQGLHASNPRNPFGMTAPSSSTIADIRAASRARRDARAKLRAKREEERIDRRNASLMAERARRKKSAARRAESERMRQIRAADAALRAKEAALRHPLATSSLVGRTLTPEPYEFGPPAPPAAAAAAQPEPYKFGLPPLSPEVEAAIAESRKPRPAYSPGEATAQAEMERIESQQKRSAEETAKRRASTERIYGNFNQRMQEIKDHYDAIRYADQAALAARQAERFAPWGVAPYTPTPADPNAFGAGFSELPYVKPVLQGVRSAGLGLRDLLTGGAEFPIFP